MKTKSMNHATRRAVIINKIGEDGDENQFQQRGNGKRITRCSESAEPITHNHRHDKQQGGDCLLNQLIA